MLSTPMRRTCSRCCARAESGQAAAPPSSVMNARRFTRSPRRRARRERETERVRALNPPSSGRGLNVIIKMELVRVRTQPDGIDLLVPLVAEPGFNNVLGEDIAAQQKRVIGFERIQRLLQRAGGGLHLLRLRGRQVIEVLVNRLARIDAIL